MRTRLLTVQESRFLEREANRLGLPFSEMMESAGRATALAVQERIELRGRPILVLVGPGNNGGDGLVAAHYLQALGAQVTCYLWRRQQGGDPNYDRVVADHVPVVWAQDDGDYPALQAHLASSHVVVDALLGVGVSRPIEGSLSELLGIVSASMAGSAHATLTPVLPRAAVARPLMVAVDCPTGLDCDTGALDPAGLTADLTVTFAGPKWGMLRFPGAGAVGEMVVADIGIPDELLGYGGWEMATAGLLRGWLPARPRSANKGTFGRALIVAGSASYPGAAVLAGTAAARVGTGLVTMALPAPAHAAVAAHLAEATYLLLPQQQGAISCDAVEPVRVKAAGYDSLLVGPGLAQEKETVAFVHALLGAPDLARSPTSGCTAGPQAAPSAMSRAIPPLVVDADALNALAAADRWWTGLPPGTILTPHPGEMARLMGGSLDAADIQSHREDVCRRMAGEWGVVVVLKGAFTLVAEPGGRQMVIPFANAGLATAGSGDVLAGAIAGLRAQGRDPFEAAVTGAFVHGLAGELVRAEMGDMGMLAGDVALRLPYALRQIRACCC